MPPTPVVLSWSGGKDSAYALYQLRQNKHYKVQCLLSTFATASKRLSMHGVREELIAAQAASIGLPLVKMYVQEDGYNDYEKQMLQTLQALKKSGIHTVAFGDIFLEDVRAYREQLTALAGMHCIFPLWKKNTRTLVQHFIAMGFKTITCCVYEAALSKAYCGQIIDSAFIHALPAQVDPCGENGEYHSFCFDGPPFSQPISITVGERVCKFLPSPDATTPQNSFWYCDLMLTTSSTIQP